MLDTIQVDVLTLHLVVAGIVGVALAALPGGLALFLGLVKGLLLFFDLSCSLAAQNHLFVVYRLLGRKDLEFLCILWRLRREPQLLVQLLSELFEFCKSLAKVVIFKVTTCLGILELSVWILIYVDSFEIGKVNVIDITVVVFVDIASFHLERAGGSRTHLLDIFVKRTLKLNLLSSFHIDQDFSKKLFFKL